jgi:putative peptide zinc metalloprotease protein
MTQSSTHLHGDKDPERMTLLAEQKQLTTPTEVPERPALGPNVELVGEMQGTGFQDRQWLIRRDGRFIQVTELLYRVAEQVNGKQTIDEIAAALTEATDWIVTPDNVRQLLQTKLIPFGLVATADGSVAPRVEDQARSPLQINLRRTIVSPRLLDLLARALQVLYTPPVLIPVLLIIAVAHGWLYFVHGVADSLRLVLYTPGGLFILLALVVVSGIFHELGHAAALRYGGGTVRGMGVGIYLVYPTLYTDVTDAYRLGRWARLRTDLGGIYFHLIFALGLMALYFLSGQQILLAAVLVINADILYQLIPYVRLDGYWALADLTGIPDFFSQMGPFLRSVLPIPGQQGSKLPPLKPWVKAVFALYILFTIPVLALLFFLIITNFPRLMVVGWSALLYQIRVFSLAWSSGDFLALAAVTSQMLLIALSMLTAIYFLYSMSRKPIGALWRWSKPTPTRSLVGTVTAVGAVAVVVLLWVPQVSFVGRHIPAGTQHFEVTERNHVLVPVTYSQVPPVGGNHAPIWQNCGFYDTPIANENAVHSLEHGTVWITYQPQLPREQVDMLRQLAHRLNYVLVSPYPDQPAPVILSAWGYQLRLDSADDARLDQFLLTFRLGPQAPEPEAQCTGGVGTPK